MSTNYPDSIDGYSQLPLVVDGTTRVDAISVNRLRDAIVAIETTIGAQPTGGYSNIKERLQDISIKKQTISMVNAAAYSNITDVGRYLPFSTDPLNVSSMQTPIGAPFSIYQKSYTKYGNSYNLGSQNPNDETDVIDTWSLNGDKKTVTSVGPAGSKYPSVNAKGGAGIWYCEFLCSQVSNSFVRIGLVGNDRESINLSTTEYWQGTIAGDELNSVAYDSSGEIWLNGERVAAELDELSDNDVVGVLLCFVDIDTISMSSAGTYGAYVHFSVNGVWQNGADPENDLTTGSLVSEDPEVIFHFINSLPYDNNAQAFIDFGTFSELDNGDYILIDGEILSFKKSYVWHLPITSTTGGVGSSVTIVTGESPTSTYTINGDSSEDASLNQYNGSGTISSIADSIVAVINSASSTIGAANKVTASKITVNSVVTVKIKTDAPYLYQNHIASVSKSGALFGTPTAEQYAFNGVTTQQIAAEVQAIIGSDPEDTSNPYSSICITTLRPDAITLNDGVTGMPRLRLQSIELNTGGNGVALSTNNATYFNISSEFYNGNNEVEITAVTNPADLSFEPNIDGLNYWISPFDSDGIVGGICVFTNDFDLMNMNAEDTVSVGRSIRIITTGDYDGGDIEITVFRSDTNQTETVTADIVPGTSFDIDIPVFNIRRARNLGTFNNGSVIIGHGKYWAPIGIPVSMIDGEISPSPLSTDIDGFPNLLIYNVNTGLHRETPTIGGDGQNMINLESLNNPINNTNTIRVAAFTGSFDIITETVILS